MRLLKMLAAEDVGGFSSPKPHLQIGDKGSESDFWIASKECGRKKCIFIIYQSSGRASNIIDGPRVTRAIGNDIPG